MKSRFLRDEMDLEILITVLFIVRDRDYKNFACTIINERTKNNCTV